MNSDLVAEYTALISQIVTTAMIAEVMKEVFDTAPSTQAEAVERARIVTPTLCVAVPLLREAFEKPLEPPATESAP